MFLIFLGLLIGAGGYFLFTGLQNNSNPLWGMDRHIALGVPMLAFGLLHVLSGVGLAITSRKAFAIAGSLATTLFVLGYFAFMISVTGELPINLISLVFVAVVIVVWARLLAFLKATPGDGGAGPQAAGAGPA